MNGRPRLQLEKLDISGTNYRMDSVLLGEIYFDSDFNCRGEFTYESVAQLSETIANTGGLIYPIILWEREGLPAGKKYQIVAGHRRYRAYELLKQERIQSIIRLDMTLRLAQVINLVENIERKNLNIIQEATALKKLYPDGAAEREISREIKQSCRWIRARYRVLELPQEVQDKFADERIPRQYVDTLFQVTKKEGPEKAIEKAKVIEAARENKNVMRKNLPPDLRGSRFKRPTQSEFIEVMTVMLDSSIVGLCPKIAAYFQGWISKEEIIKEIKKRVPKWAVRSVEELNQ